MKQKAPLSPQNEIAIATRRYSVGRTNLLILAAFTLINIVMLAIGDYTYFLFSATLPYLLVDYGMFFTGRYPEEIYGDGYETLEFFDNSFFYIMLAISLVIILFYVLCFILSKKQKVGWLIAALVFFIIDTAVLFYFYDLTSNIINVLFHIYAIVYLCLAIAGHFKLKELSKQESEIVIDAPSAEFSSGTFDAEGSSESANEAVNDSVPLRAADRTVKSRTLLEATVYGHKVEYRRIKKVNELVIDGYVYGEYTAVIERAHQLTAIIDGHYISAGYNGYAASTITVDGQIAATKTRWI